MHIEAEETQKLRECSLAELPPVTLELVTDVQNWKRWKDLVERYHYLGVRMPTGRRLQYLVYAGEQPIGALGWKGGSLTLRARDCYVGWDPRQRQQYLDHVINNYRFVLVDWLRVANLFSVVWKSPERSIWRGQLNRRNYPRKSWGNAWRKPCRIYLQGEGHACHEPG